MGRKTLWEKEKLLVMSNFSFSHSVFKRLVWEWVKQNVKVNNHLLQDKILVLSNPNHLKMTNVSQNIKFVFLNPFPNGKF